ncbi:Fur family transcriptional regulator [Heliophilum fasciatum]|uniref:Fur family ferric uptake regulator n=1 Tax=Heliophilum fasciatum TaxID=35700 RepID=A0A4R2RQE8_9FIRM|nr:Fur family transcriptional regulator [Heliophilum fasciatum]MCW2278928.1 Fur family ferric uptake transcriptional regulator [Heliophilum fasciatum]TCP62061.1 Fur family ferric uptake regulator [Heliophilum fasciatum]
MDRFEDLCDQLQKNDYKLTNQRKNVIKAFIMHADSHLSAEDIYGIVKQKHPEIGLATVYRTLELLAELEILHKLDFGDGRLRYEFANQKTHHHHHLICTDCAKVIEFEDDMLDSLEQVIHEKNGFQILNHHLKFYGICQACQKEKTRV